MSPDLMSEGVWDFHEEVLFGIEILDISSRELHAVMQGEGGLKGVRKFPTVGPPQFSSPVGDVFIKGWHR